MRGKQLLQKFNQQKANSHTLNQALVEGADEAFSSWLTNEGAQSAVMMNKKANDDNIRAFSFPSLFH
jgi:hypothetical protein